MNFELIDWYPVFLSLRVALMALILITVIGLPVCADSSRAKACWKPVTLPLVLPPSG